MNFISSLNLASQTPLEKEDLRKMRTILTFLMDNNDSSQFRTPVDWQGLELTDYPLIITHPMDLGTVCAKMQADQYRFVESVLDDIQLIWDNCKRYNLSGSWIYGVADKMDKYFKKLIKNYFTQVVISAKPLPLELHEPLVSSKPTRTNRKNQNRLQSESEQNEVSSTEKNKIIDSIKNLDADDLGTIVQFIKEKCPRACFETEQRKLSIVTTQIESWLYRELKAYLYLQQENWHNSHKAKTAQPKGLKFDCAWSNVHLNHLFITVVAHTQKYKIWIGILTIV